MIGILISHSDSDRLVAEDLRSRLAELAVPGVAGFVSLTSGVSERPLRAEMSAAKALVVLLSESVRQDSRVLAEAGLAVSLGKPVIAVLLEGTRPEDFDFIDSQVWLQAAGTKGPGQLASLINEAVAGLIT